MGIITSVLSKRAAKSIRWRCWATPNGMSKSAMMAEKIKKLDALRMEDMETPLGLPVISINCSASENITRDLQEGPRGRPFRRQDFLLGRSSREKRKHDP